MTVSTSITHAQLSEALASLRFGIGPSDLHGSLTGYLCAGGACDARGWLLALELQPAIAYAAEVPHPLLERLYSDCCAQLDDPELGFEPLLPDAESSIGARADALVEWCRGFLGGLGLAGMQPRQQLSADGAEILDDFGTIAHSRFEYADAEEDETALAEVLEFIRVAVLLLHTELSAMRRGAVTLH